MVEINEVREKFNQVLQYHEEVGFDPKLDVIWNLNMADLHQIINSAESTESLIDHIDRTFMFAINFPVENAQNTGLWVIEGDHPQKRERQIQWLLNEQQQRGIDVFAMPESIQESEFIHHRNQIKKSNRLLSGNFLRTLSIAWEIFKHTQTKSFKHILEIGGGAGHLARTLALLAESQSHTIIDLPETLCFSYGHLNLCFPEKKHLFVTCPEEIAKVDNYDFIYIPVAFAESLHERSYDLFVNTASMGEMRNEVIRHWMDFIQNKVTVHHLFTLNRFLNTVEENGRKSYRINENECSVSYDDNWEILNWELEPPYTRCPYIDTLHSRYLQIVAKRPWDIEGKKKLAETLYEDVVEEDWVKLEGQYIEGVMTYRDNILVNDMTMTGTLFKLWESIRLDMNKDNVSLMLKYLDRLVTIVPMPKHFEEVQYYLRVLKEMEN